MVDLFAGQEAPDDALVVVQGAGWRPPLFVVHNGFGEHFFARYLAAALGEEQPVFAVRLPRAPVQSDTALSDLARRYVSAVRRAQPAGPYYLFGDCFGGIVAFEMAVQLRAGGHDVALLAAFDIVAPSLVSGFDLSPEIGKRLEAPPTFVARLRADTVRSVRGGARQAVGDGIRAVAHGWRRVIPMLRWRLSSAERARRRREAERKLQIVSLMRYFGSYAPTRKFDGSTLLLFAKDNGFWGIDESDLGWSRDLTGEVRHAHMNCDHAAIETIRSVMGEIANEVRLAIDASIGV